MEIATTSSRTVALSRFYSPLSAGLNRSTSFYSESSALVHGGKLTLVYNTKSSVQNPRVSNTHLRSRTQVCVCNFVSLYVLWFVCAFSSLRFNILFNYNCMLHFSFCRNSKTDFDSGA